MQFTSVQDFLDHVQGELDANRLVLPTLPDVALKVRDAVTKGDSSAAELAEIIVTDASLSTRLIQVANSPLYRGTNPNQQHTDGCISFGEQDSRNFNYQFSHAADVYAVNKHLEEHFRKTWEQSINVSSISRALSFRSTS